MESSRAAGAGLAAVAGALLLAPNIYWILQDQSAWPWDQAFHAFHTLLLSEAAGVGIGRWTAAMVAVGIPHAPLIAWLGQLFVPLRDITGEIEPALLHLNLLWNGITLWLIYHMVRELGAGPLERTISVVACAASGIFIAMNHQFLTETTQCGAAAVMMYAALQVERRSLIQAASLTVIAIGLALLSKISSITFILPFVCYIAFVSFVTRKRPRPPTSRSDVLLAIIAGGVALVCVAWYATNGTPAIQHFIRATSGEVALRYGTPVELSRKLEYWSYWLGKSISPFPLVWAATIALIGLAAVVSIIRLKGRWSRSTLESLVDNGVLFALTLAGTICAIILVFSLQVNEDTRFLIVTAPMVAVLVGWSLSVFRVRAVSAMMLAALLTGALANHGHAFGHDPFGVAPYNWLWPIEHNPAEKNLLERAVRVTCHNGNEGRRNVIAVNYFWLNINSINFVNAKQALGGNKRCSYWQLAEAEDVPQAIAEIATMMPQYIITISPEEQLPLGTLKAPAFANKISRPLAEAMGRDPRFKLVSESSDDYLLIYTFRGSP
jgi:hypothetical protein